MDGYVGLFRTPDAGSVPAPIITNTGATTVKEVTERASNGAIRSNAEIVITGLDCGTYVLNHANIEYRKSAQPATAIIKLHAQPADGTTITINGSTTPYYTFKTTPNQAGHVKIGASVFETAVNLFHAINATSGKAGTSYYTGTTANAHVTAIMMNATSILLRAKTRGTAGNSYTLTTSDSSNAYIKLTLFTEQLTGAVADTLWTPGISNIKLHSGDTAGWTGSSQGGTLTLRDLPVNPIVGIFYEFRLKYYNADNETAIDGSSNPVVVLAVDFATYGTTNLTYIEFDGRDDLTELVEVTGLQCINASNMQGNPTTPTLLPSNGIARLVWDDMKQLPFLKNALLCAPNSSGTPTRTTGNVDGVALAQLTEYYIFMYVANSATAPARTYPRSDGNEANGNWYLVGRTTNNYAEINCPKSLPVSGGSKNIGFWVGFGTTQTISTSVAPFYKVLTEQ